MNNQSFSTKSRIFTVLISGLIAVSLSLSVGESFAFADVRKADIILGQSVETRDLSIADCPSIDCEYALVMLEDGTVFFERNAYTETTIASIVKIMTALVALDEASLDDTITVGERAAQIGESSAALQVGDTLDLRNALCALMIPSGNDAAMAIAESVGKSLLEKQGISSEQITEESAEEAFVLAMNTKADELNLTNTLFTNPHGLDDGEHASDQKSCASDVAIIARTAMQNEVFREIVAMPEGKLDVKHADGKKESLTVESTNELLYESSPFIGIKTGFTDSAGASFAGAATSKQGDLYAIVLNSTSLDQRFTDAQSLVTWMHEHYIDYPLIHTTVEHTVHTEKNPFSSDVVGVVAEVAHTDWIDKTVKATLLDQDQAVSVFDLNGNIAQTVEYDNLTGNIEVGDKVGTCTFTQRGEIVQVVDIVAAEQVLGPSFFESVGIWWERLFNNFSGGQDVAESKLINTTPLIHNKSS